MIYDNIYNIEDIKDYMMKDTLGIEIIDNDIFNYEIKGKDIINFLQKVFENKTLNIEIKIKD